MRRWMMPGMVTLVALIAGCPADNYRAAGFRKEAITEFQVGHIAKAKPMFRQALQADPSDPVALYYMGRIYCEEQDWENAIYYFQCCLDVEPGNADARAWLLKAEEATEALGTKLRFIPVPPARK